MTTEKIYHEPYEPTRNNGKMGCLWLSIFFFLFVLLSCENPLMKQAFGLKTVSFNSNGGSAVESQHLLKGELIARPGDPVRALFVFGGWFTDNNTFLNQWDFRVAPDREFVLYAKWIAVDSFLYTLILDTDELDVRDLVSFSDSGAFEIIALGGSVAAIDYILADTDSLTSELRFYIMGARIFTADEPGSGIFDYVVNADHAVDGIITIKAVSIHTDLIPLDEPTGVSFNSDGEISFTPGENNHEAGVSFMFSLYRNASPVSGFSYMPIASGGGVFAQLRGEMLKDVGSYNVRVWAETANPDYLSPSIAVYSNNVDVYRLILDTDDLYNSDSVSFSNIDSVLETTAFGGNAVTVYYTLVDVYFNNLLSLYIDGNRKYETTAPGTGSYDYTVNSDDADNRVITMYARSVHSNLELLHAPDNVHFDKSGEISFTADSRNPAGTSYRYTLYRNNSAVSGFTGQSITNGTTPAGIVEEMLKSSGDYHAAVWAQIETEGYEPLSSAVHSNNLHVYSVSVNISGTENGDTVSVSGRAGEHTASFEFYAFGGDTVTLNAMPGAGRMVTWSGDGVGTGNTCTITNITGAVSITAEFAEIPIVTVSANGGTAVNFQNLSAALASITTAGDYTVTLYEDQELGSTTVDVAGADITLVGADAERTIQFTGGSTPMLDLSGDNLRFTLENNITLRGTGGNVSLVRMYNGQSSSIKTYFVMKDGSKITGHNFTGGSTVFIQDGYFIMDGGEISGNHTSADFSLSTAGLSIAINSTVRINGGRIKGNTQGSDAAASDIAITSLDDALLILSGNSEIGAIRLFQNGSEACSITVDNFSGTAIIDLVTLWSTLQETRNNWTNRQIIKPYSGTLSAAAVDRFTPGNFFWSNSVLDFAPISGTHFLGTSGADLGRLVLANAPVTVTVDSVTTGYADLTSAFDAIGTTAGDYTVTLLENQTMTAERTISTAGQNITIVGSGGSAAGERTITHNITNAATQMFTISNAAASLTLGNNVTIQGRTEAGAGAVVSMTFGTFTMQGNSRIQGHTVSGLGAVIMLGGTFNMRDSAVITGVTTSSETSAAVYISSSVGNAIFNMQGGQITANSNSTAATTTTVTSGVTLLNGGVINMTGGSITGNTHSGEASDVYNAITSVDRLNISGNAQIGTLKLNATSITAVASTVTIGAAGWTGEITTLNLRGHHPVIATASGFWTNSDRIIFNGITAAQVSQIRLGEFISFNNERLAITDTHIIGTSGADLGRLIEKPIVTVTVNSVTTNHADLTAAFAAIGTQAGNFTVTLFENQTMTANRTINTADQHITIVGEGGGAAGERTINGSSIGTATTMFTISNANASLTLGNNITIQGRTTAGTGAVINNTNGTFRMLAGSRITGHRSNNGTSAAVNITGADSVFEMSGGSIDGNNTSAALTTTTASGGVYFTAGTITMSGGSITGNTQGAEASDVYHAVQSANSFTMSGDAQIGALKLNATGITNTWASTVTVGAAGWTGSITTFNLRGNIAAIATAAGYWTDSSRTIFSGITASQVSQIGLGEFISSNNERQAIGPAYMIGTEGANLGRLVLDPNLAPVSVTENGVSTGYLDLATAFTAIGSRAGDFTITLREDQTMSGRSINPSQNITIVGEGAIRTINCSTNTIFTVNAAASLTLGNNVTLTATTAGTGVFVGGTFTMQGNSRIQNFMGTAVDIWSGGIFNMRDNSVITGVTTSTFASAAVYLNNANAIFNMQGGQITANRNSSDTINTSANAGVQIVNGTFNMTGGSITGNIHGSDGQIAAGTAKASDVFIGTAASFTMSGNAEIGALRLNASSTASASVTAAGWTGSITTLNLRGEINSVTSAAGYWTNSTRTIFNGITPAQVANIGLGEFVSSTIAGGGNMWQAISLTHMIGTSGGDLGRLVVRPVYNIGDTGPAGGTIFYRNLSGFTVQGYGNPGDPGYFASYTALYLEAAPANESGFLQWGAQGTSIDSVTTWEDATAKDAGLAASIGVGRKDTQTIVNSPAFAALTNTAAQRCANKTLNGFTDWFLPSLGELNEMYKARGQGWIPTIGWFWSTAQGTAFNAWSQGFGNGNQSTNFKGLENNDVRAIRAF